MKKFLLCIGAFLVLFLVIGVYTAQAQGDLRDFDGTWLKLTVNFKKGLEFAGYHSTDAPQKMKSSAYNIYACMDSDGVQVNDTAYLRYFDKDGTAIGWGTLSWAAGTNLDFLGYLSFYIATNLIYIPGPDGFPADASITDTSLYGAVSVKGKAVDKIKIQSISGIGDIQAPGAVVTTVTYAGFGYIVNGGFTKDKKIPTITPACGDLFFSGW